jgi:hypothetical protein
VSSHGGEAGRDAGDVVIYDKKIMCKTLFYWYSISGTKLHLFWIEIW